MALAACGDDSSNSSSEPAATYVGGGCDYEGPTEFDLGDTVTFTVTNDSETSSVGFAVLTLPEGATSEEFLEEGIFAVVDEETHKVYEGAWPPNPRGVPVEMTVTFDTSGQHGINCFDQSGDDHDGDGLDYMTLFTVNE